MCVYTLPIFAFNPYQNFWISTTMKISEKLSFGKKSLSYTTGDRGDGQGCNFFGSIFFPSKQYIDTITEFSFEFYSRKLLINVKILGCGNYLIV